MKLAFAIFKYFPYGGLQRDMMRIAEESARRHHQITIYTMSTQGEIPPSINIEILPTIGWSNHRRAQNFAAQLQKKLAANKPDIFFTFNRLPGADLYFAADNCFALAKPRFRWLYKLLPRYRTFLAFEKAIFSPASKTKILYLTPGQLTDFQSVYHTPTERFKLLPPGISENRKRPKNSEIIREAKRRELGISQEEILLIEIGSSFRTKGVDRSLRAVAALPEALKNRTKLLVAGRDSSNFYPKLAKSLGINEKVSFAGGRDDIVELLLAADLLIHPARNEATGTVLIEALAAGTPVITTDNCGFANFVAESGGVVIPGAPFNQAEFNQALNAVLTNPGKLQELQKLAIAYGENANFYHRAETAVDYIEEIAHANHH